MHGAQRAIALWPDRPAWQRLQRAGMRQDFSWRQSAQRYLALYRSLALQRSQAQHRSLEQ